MTWPCQPLCGVNRSYKRGNKRPLLDYSTPLRLSTWKSSSREQALKRLTSHMLLFFFFLRLCWDSCQVDHFKIILRQFACQREEAFSEPTMKSLLLLSTLHCVKGTFKILKTIRWSNSGLFYATMAVKMKTLSSELLKWWWTYW